MSFPLIPLPSNWLSVIATYHAYAYGVPDSSLPYSFTGDISANTSAQWNAVTWTDVRPQPTYATLSDPALQQEGLSNMGIFLSGYNQLPDHAQIASSAGAITSLTGSLSSLASTVSGMAKTTSADARSLTTSTGAAGFQVSSAKPVDVKYTVSVSATSSIGASATSAVVLEMCATNSSTPSDWVEVDRVETDQTVTLAIALQSVQKVVASVSKNNVPAGYYLKLRNIGTGTHSEAFVEGEATIYG